MIARLLHIANSQPPASKAKRERFYAMKKRILRWFGTEDGHDLQFIEGKKCWSCEGTGGLYEPHGCYKCGGDGWWKSPVWILLKRWKFGGYTFHEPMQRFYRKPDTHSHAKPIIEGYIEHASYPWEKVQRARFILALMFDWRLLWSETDSWLIRKVISRRCGLCNRHLWTVKKLQCSSCQRVKTIIEEDHDIPF